MPELPDLEIARRYVDATSLHQRIGSVLVRNEKVLGAVSARKLQSALPGRSFQSARRLLFAFENGHHLAFDDGRMFGKVDLIGEPEAYLRDRQIGPDPLEMDAASFRERLRETKAGIKATLMNQKVLAGIGNLYSDEILFQARIHPKTSVAQLDDPTLENLHHETLRVLKKAIEQEAYPQELPDSYLLSHRQEGARCPRGNGEIQKLKAAGRTAYICPTCQGACRRAEARRAVAR